MNRISEARLIAQEIGEDLGENGLASVLPWATSYSYWPLAVDALGFDRAVAVAEEARARAAHTGEVIAGGD